MTLYEQLQKAREEIASTVWFKYPDGSMVELTSGQFPEPTDWRNKVLKEAIKYPEDNEYFVKISDGGPYYVWGWHYKTKTLVYKGASFDYPERMAKKMVRDRSFMGITHNVDILPVYVPTWSGIRGNL